MYRYAKLCGKCKGKGERNARYGAKLSDETREKIRQAALQRPRKPRKQRKSTTPESGREFARRWFPMPLLCERCHLVPPLDRHHRDGNPQNNHPSNISCLCRKCHQIEDGRHTRMLHEIPSRGGKATRGRKHKS